MLAGTEEADGRVVEEKEEEEVEEVAGLLVVLGHTFPRQSNQEPLKPRRPQGALSVRMACSTLPFISLMKTLEMPRE